MSIDKAQSVEYLLLQQTSLLDSKMYSPAEFIGSKLGLDSCKQIENADTSNIFCRRYDEFFKMNPLQWKYTEKKKQLSKNIFLAQINITSIKLIYFKGVNISEHYFHVSNISQISLNNL